MVDISGSEGRDPISDFEIINEELSSYKDTLYKLPQIVVGTKSDLVNFGDTEFERYVKKEGYEFYKVSSATVGGVNELKAAIYNKLRELPPVAVFESEVLEDEYSFYKMGEKETEYRIEDGEFIVEGRWLQNLLGSVNVYDYESSNYFHRVLKNSGVFDELTKMGVKEGDTVKIYDIEFEYVE